MVAVPRRYDDEPRALLGVLERQGVVEARDHLRRNAEPEVERSAAVHGAGRHRVVGLGGEDQLLDPLPARRRRFRAGEGHRKVERSRQRGDGANRRPLAGGSPRAVRREAAYLVSTLRRSTSDIRARAGQRLDARSERRQSHARRDRRGVRSARLRTGTPIRRGCVAENGGGPSGRMRLSISNAHAGTGTCRVIATDHEPRAVHRYQRWPIRRAGQRAPARRPGGTPRTVRADEGRGVRRRSFRAARRRRHHARAGRERLDLDDVLARSDAA